MRLRFLFSFASLAFAAPAPLLQGRDVRSLIANKFIVKFKESTEVSAVSNFLSSMSIEADHVYEGLFNGFAATLGTGVLQKIRGHPSIEYVEQDAIISIDSLVTQPTSQWNLARISHRSNGASNYIYDESAGEGTCIYVVDTGIQVDHPAFSGRAIMAANFVSGSANTDGNGHGTAMAGIAGSTTLGVAKKAQLIGIKVLDDNGSGTTSGVLSGISYVTTDSATRSCPKGVIVNLSIGGSYSTSLNAAVAALVNSNKFASVSAGNSASNIANYSPASEPLACTVGSTASTDAVMSGSNYGSLLDIWAPGQSILTTYIGSTNATLSGSIGAAHISGLGAYIASLEGVAPSALCARLRELATQNVLTGIPTGTSNLLAYNGNGA